MNPALLFIIILVIFFWVFIKKSHAVTDTGEPGSKRRGPTTLPPKSMPYYVLFTIIFISLIIVIQAGLSLRETHKINTFIASDSIQKEGIPLHLKAQFSQAYREARKGEFHSALQNLTFVIGTDDKKLKAAAYYNRANIYLQMAKILEEKDSRLSSIALAKQDYRKSLLLDSSNWNVRFNLELALLFQPETPIKNSGFKRNISQSKAVRAVGFSVDLP